MPTYQYQCTECGNSLEVRQSFTDDALTVCPSCEGALRKVFNAVGVVFKGSGFYRTDSRANGSGAATEKADASTKGSSSSTDSGSSSSSGDSSGGGSSTGGSSSGSSSDGAASGSSAGKSSSGSSSTAGTTKTSAA